jgi:hypothetical protein
VVHKPEPDRYRLLGIKAPASKTAGTAPPAEPRPALGAPNQRLGLVLLAALALTFVLLGPIINAAGAWGCFTLAAVYFVAGFWLWGMGRGRPLYGLGMMATGVAMATIGIGYALVTPRSAENPLADRPAEYYQAWLAREQSSVTRSLAGNQRATLTFEAGRENVLRIEAVNLAPDQQRALAGRIRSDFRALYPGQPFSAKLVESGRSSGAIRP